MNKQHSVMKSHIDQSVHAHTRTQPTSPTNTVSISFCKSKQITVSVRLWSVYLNWSRYVVDWFRVEIESLIWQINDLKRKMFDYDRLAEGKFSYKFWPFCCRTCACTWYCKHKEYLLSVWVFACSVCASTFIGYIHTNRMRTNLDASDVSLR